MKELEVVPGDSVYDIFRKAWLLYWKLKKEPVCFHHNETRIIIMFDGESIRETEILTKEQVTAIVEDSEEDQK